MLMAPAHSSLPSEGHTISMQLSGGSSTTNHLVKNDLDPDVDAEMDLNDLMAVFLVISRSTSVLGSAGRSFLPAELRAAFCWSSAKQRKSVKKTSSLGRVRTGGHCRLVCTRI